MTVLCAQSMLMSAGGGGGITVTWNPADKNALIDLSNNNLTATRGSAVSENKAARATTSYNAGKYYFEIEVDVATASGLGGGLATSLFNVNTGDLYASTQSWVLFSLTGQPYHDSSAVGTALGEIPNGNRMMFAVDFDAGKIWMGGNGTFSGDPAAGTGERFTFTPNTALFPALTLYVEFSQLTGAFRAADFVHTVPAGFSPWDS